MDETTDRVHTSYQLAAATTGRLASSDPNLQNIPIRTEKGRQIRQAFIAAPGHVLISADYSQIELRLLAHIGDIPELKRAFRPASTSTPPRPPRCSASPSTRWTPRPAAAPRRSISASSTASPPSAWPTSWASTRARPAPISRPISSASPASATIWTRTRAEVREQPAIVSTVFGRRIHIPAIHSKSAAERQFGERAAINAPIQGAAADIIRRAMIRMPAALEAAGLSDAKMLLQVHDELVFEAPEAEAETRHRR